MSCDHRIIDGALGANFLKEIKTYIIFIIRLCEIPETLLY